MLSCIKLVDRKEKEKVTKEKAIKILQQQINEDATFNIVGKKSIQTTIEAGLIKKSDSATIQNIPFTIILL